MEGKPTLRRRHRAIRDELAASDRVRMNGQILTRLFTVPGIEEAPALMTYVSKSSEVDTWGIIRRSLEARHAIYVPKVKNDYDLAWFRLRCLEDLELGRFGVMEPQVGGSNAEEVPGTDVPIVVPGLAFSEAGDRLGHGGGYFDRFLAGRRGMRIGLAYEVQLVGSLPTGEHDQRMDVIVTENRVLCKRRDPEDGAGLRP